MQTLGTVHDKYTVGRKLGQGRFSEVYLVSEKATPGMWAMKVIDKKLLKKGESGKQILNEMEILKELHHPNIVQLREIIDRPKDKHI